MALALRRLHTSAKQSHDSQTIDQAFAAETYAHCLTFSPHCLCRSKAKEEAAKALGAKGILVSSDKEAMKEAKGTLNGIIDTVSAPHDVNEYLALLLPKGKLIEVGLPPGANEVNHFQLVQR